MQSSFYDEPVCIQKRLQESMDSAQYHLNVPGPGHQLPFLQDPHIRLQGWSANLMMDTVNLESDLLGLTQSGRNGDIEEYYKHRVPQQPVSYPVKKPFVEETRTIAPAWIYRETDVSNRSWSFPLLNPLRNLETPFLQNVETRIVAKDYTDLKNRSRRQNI